MDILKLAKSINKDLGLSEGGVQASKSPALAIKRLRTGSLTYDICTGGGLPIGRITGIDGLESSGKTTVALLSLASYFRSNDKRPAIMIDSEHAYNKKYAKTLGINDDRLLIYQPDNLEQASAMTKKVISENLVGMLVFDSIKSSIPEKIITEDVESHNLGLHAKMMGNLIGSVNPISSRNEITTIWINQQRESIGGYGGGKVSPAGNALKFYASVRIETFRGSKKKNKDTGEYTNEGWIRVIKNKTAPPYQEGKYIMRHGTGICVSTEILDYGVDCGVLYKKGHTFYYDPTFENNEEKRKEHTTIGNGKDKARVTLDENPDLRDELYEIILNTYLNKDV